MAPRRGFFPAVKDLQAAMLALIGDYNRAIAEPHMRSYQGKPLVA